MTHLLVLGAGGQIGRALMAQAHRAGVPCRGMKHAECDIADPAALTGAVADCRLVVNCAAYTAVDKAETEPELAHRINAEGAGNVAAACAQAGVPLIHLSTDYVFDGERGEPMREDEPTRPLGVYGQSKLAGEFAVREQLPAHIILRTSWVFSAWGQNFVRTMLRLAARQSEIRVVDDQIGGPTAATDVADAILTIADICATPGWTNWGTYHFSGAPATSWCGFARAILRGHDVRVTAIGTQDYPTPAQRPRYSVLDCSRIDAVFRIGMPDWRLSLRQVLDELAAGGEP